MKSVEMSVKAAMTDMRTMPGHFPAEQLIFKKNTTF